jgi:hypothetical protein
VIVEIHGWTKRSDGTLWLGTMVVSDPPDLTEGLIGTLWHMAPLVPRPDVDVEINPSPKRRRLSRGPQPIARQ